VQTSSEDAKPPCLSTEQLYRAHRPFVARFLTRLGVQPQALDDAVQEVFVTVHKRGGYVLGPAKPTSYLATIAINTAAAQRRTSRMHAARQCEQAPEELASPGDDPVHALETQQELQRLERALAKLDPALRSTLLRADGEGESCVAIADATAVPVGTVYWRLVCARKKFREALRRVDRSRRAGERHWVW
jgi:RNA polymerase sigma-70 factor (ECF subfamily)